MRYPMEEGPSYPNSQVWGHGGGSGPSGGQCHENNYSYPWRDNYCETRSWSMPLCPSGQGHQGQDIRPATCDDGLHWNVAAQAGTITNIGSFSAYVTAADGTCHDYLHGTGNIIGSGQSMARGERINRVSNEFGGTPTTIHLHYNIKQDVAGLGFIFVSPYMSLVESYEELLGIGADVVGAVSQEGCSPIVGWAQDEAAPEVSIPVRVFSAVPPTIRTRSASKSSPISNAPNSATAWARVTTASRSSCRARCRTVSRTSYIRTGSESTAAR